MEIRWTDRVRNEEVIQRVKETNILQTINILRRNCLVKHVIEGEIWQEYK
jgi:hypothetical protein